MRRLRVLVAITLPPTSPSALRIARLVVDSLQTQGLPATATLVSEGDKHDREDHREPERQPARKAR